MSVIEINTEIILLEIQKCKKYFGFDEAKLDTHTSLGTWLEDDSIRKY